MNPVDIQNKVWSKLEEGLSGNHYIAFDYTKNGITYRISMKPYQLIYYNGMWSLYGYEINPGYEGIRFFNLPVIKNIQIKKETFELPENFAYEKHAIGNFGRHIGSETYTFKVIILVDWIADYAKTYNWAPDQKFEGEADGTTVMSFTSNQYYPVLDWVLQIGKFIIPVAPERLVDDWKDHALAMANIAKEL